MTEIEEQRQEQKYKSGLNYEYILGGQLTRVAIFRDTSVKKYASSVDTLIYMCPEIIRENSIKKRKTLGLTAGNYEGVNENKLSVYDELWIFINKELEDRNLIFKTSMFELGSENKD